MSYLDNFHNPQEKRESLDLDSREIEEEFHLSGKPPQKPSPIFRYLMQFSFYFLFLELIFFGFSMEMGHEKILFFAFLISLMEPLKEYLQAKHLKEEEERFLNNPLALEEGLIREARFTEILRSSQKRPPLMTSSLLFLNFFFFFACMIAGGTTHSEVLARFGSKISGLILVDGEYWRILSAAFLHVGPIHLIMNMLVLYLFGGFIEKIFGGPSYLVIYTGSAIFGMIGSLLMIAEPGAGASGALFGVIGTLLVFGFRYRQWIPLRFRDLYTWILCCYVLLDFMIAFSVTRFDVYAHLGGLIGGSLMAYILDIDPKIKTYLFGILSAPPRWKGTCIFLGSILSGILIFASLFQALENAYFPHQLHSQAPMISYKNQTFGLTMSIPKNWKRITLPTPTLLTWRSSCGHVLTLMMDKSESLSPQKEAYRYLIHQIPKAYQNEVKCQLVYKKFRFPSHIQDKMRGQIFYVYNPFESQNIPTSAWMAVCIQKGCLFILKLEVFEPLKFTDLFQRLLNSLDFSGSFHLDKGVAQFESLLLQNQGNPLFLNQYSWFLAKFRLHLDKALKLAKQAHFQWIKIFKAPNPAILDTLGEVYYQMEKYSQALECFEKAKKAAPQISYFELQYEKAERALSFQQQVHLFQEKLEKK